MAAAQCTKNERTSRSREPTVCVVSHSETHEETHEEKAVEKISNRDVSEISTWKMSKRVNSTFNISRQICDNVELHFGNLRRQLAAWGDVRRSWTPHALHFSM